ncbi:MAG: UDP-N-acetylmuramoyl-L-alanine--D-glutamate ligase, partial [Actinomycetota bacterium]
MTLGARRVVVAGLGVSGAAAAEALLEEGADGAEVVVTDTADSPALRKSAALLEARGVEVRLGEGHLDVLEGAELVVTSPGIPPRAPLLAAALGRGIPIWSEVELAWRLAEVPVMAVTGTNGKTTTASLLADILCEGGTPAVAAGNIGLPLVTAVRSAAPGSVVVCELSSFQLAFIESFRPAAAILLNVADDHYDWHRGPADYLEAKGRITMNQGPEELFVFPAGDPAALTVASGSRARLAAFGLEAPAEVLGAAEARLGRAVVAGAGLLLEVLAVASGHGLRVLLP